MNGPAEESPGRGRGSAVCPLCRAASFICPVPLEHVLETVQRLNTDEEFPGSGIGLATVHRIVDRRGGRVWAEGAVGQGAAVFFAVPAAPRMVS